MWSLCACIISVTNSTTHGARASSWHRPSRRDLDATPVPPLSRVRTHIQPTMQQIRLSLDFCSAPRHQSRFEMLFGPLWVALCHVLLLPHPPPLFITSRPRAASAPFAPLARARFVVPPISFCSDHGIAGAEGSATLAGEATTRGVDRGPAVSLFEELLKLVSAAVGDGWTSGSAANERSRRSR